MAIHRIRLSKMQKIVNAIALASGIVSLSVIGSGVYVYLQKDAIIDSIKEKAIESVMGSMGGIGGLGGGDLPIGTPDLTPPSDSAAVGGGLSLPVPSSPL